MSGRLHDNHVGDVSLSVDLEIGLYLGLEPLCQSRLRIGGGDILNELWWYEPCLCFNCALLGILGGIRFVRFQTILRRWRILDLFPR